MNNNFEKASQAFDQHIPHCDPRLKKYYFAKAQEFNVKFTDAATFEEQLLLRSGYVLALISVCKDLNAAAMDAKFDEIMSKLNEK